MRTPDALSQSLIRPDVNANGGYAARAARTSPHIRSLHRAPRGAIDHTEAHLGDDLSVAELAAVQLAVMLIAHLRQGNADRLSAEGLSIALAACALCECNIDGVSVVGTDPRIARAADYIETHLGEDLSVDDIAAVAAMSPSSLQSAFKAVTGRPVFAYVRERRLERARILLADRRLSLAQIAYDCGFSSHSHMTRLFTARYGASPRAMR